MQVESVESVVFFEARRGRAALGSSQVLARNIVSKFEFMALSPSNASLMRRLNKQASQVLLLERNALISLTHLQLEHF